MKKINFIKGCLALFLLWMGTFFVFRLLFVFRYFDQIENISSILKFGLSSDISTASIIVSTSICFLIFSYKRNKKITFSLFKTYSIALIVLVTLVEYSSLILYAEWGSTVSYKAISYLTEGIHTWKSAFKSIDFYLIIYVLLGIAFFRQLNQILRLFFLSVSNSILHNKSQLTR